MTYIIAGQLSGIKYLMSDCIATGEDGEGNKTYCFAEKVKELLSDRKSFFAMTGPGYLSQLIESYDYWLQSQKAHIDFATQSNVNSLVEFIKHAHKSHPDKNAKLSDSRIFIISQRGVFFFDLTFNHNSELTREAVLYQVKDKHFIDSNLGSQYNPMGSKAESTNKFNLREYCLKQLKDLAKDDGERAELFDNRIQFIVFNDDGDNVYEPAFRYPSDVVAAFFSLPYQVIDNDEFKFIL